VKEKYLKNHLEREPPGDADESEEIGPEQEPRDLAPEIETLEGVLTTAGLEADNQVVRAMEILISYDIFKNLKG
jgi:carboxyl-terminal processing protease